MVRHVEKYVAECQRPRAGQTTLQETPKPPHVLDLENRLRMALGTRVTIIENRGRGKIVIDFFSPEDFDRVLDKLT